MQVIDFMLDAMGEYPIERVGDPLSIDRLAFDQNQGLTLDPDQDAWTGQAPFIHVRDATTMFDDRIDDDQRFMVNEHDDHALPDADLGGCQADALMGQHQTLHVRCQVGHRPVEASDRSAGLPQDGIGEDAQEQAHSGLAEAGASP